MIRKKLKDFGFGSAHSPFNFRDYMILASFFPEGGEATMQEVIKRTGLAYAPVNESLNSLAKAGVLEKKTVGRTGVFRMDLGSSHAFMGYTQYQIYQNIEFSEKYPKVYRLLKRIIESTNPMALIVYGSYAKGEARKDSDVDFLIVDDKFRHPGGKLPNYDSVISGEEMSSGYELNGLISEYLEFANEDKDRAFWQELKQWGIALEGWDTTYNAFYRRRNK